MDLGSKRLGEEASGMGLRGNWDGCREKDGWNKNPREMGRRSKRDGLRIRVGVMVDIP